MSRVGLLAVLFVLAAVHSQPAYPQENKRLLLRVDDVGMCHTVNQAMQQLAATGMPFSTSVMFACPWYLEAVDILKAHPQIAVGVHLTLNAEWQSYKWGPVLGKAVVPSLVDVNGYFFASHADFASHEIGIDEVERELQAQIERALRSGVRIDYLDYHMGTAVSTPELTAVVEKLAQHYALGLSTYFDEAYQTIWHIPIDQKKDSLYAAIEHLQVDRPNLMVVHVGLESPEMNALVDMNSSLMSSSSGESLVGRHRHAELNALSARDFRKAIGKNRVTLITYRDLIAQAGLKAMQRPE